MLPVQILGARRGTPARADVAATMMFTERFTKTPPRDAATKREGRSRTFSTASRQASSFASMCASQTP